MSLVNRKEILWRERHLPKITINWTTGVNFIYINLIYPAIYCPNFEKPARAKMTPEWGSDGLAPENRRVDKTVKAECPNHDEVEVERFKNGELINQIKCMETGEWDRQFDDCERT